MSQAPTDGINLLDPWGIWKTARDTNLEAWSKFMIDLVNSDEYAQATGLALEQALATSQPLRDTMEKTMTQTLSLLNMPSRAEVISLAERLVNMEMRLDDMDAKLTAVQKSLQATIKEAIGEIARPDAQLKNIASQVEALDAKYDTIKRIETQLAEMSTKLGTLQVQPAPAPAPQPVSTAQLAVVARPAAAPKPEPKPVTAAAPKPVTATVAKPEPKPTTVATTATLPKPVTATAPKPEPKPVPTTATKPGPKPQPKAAARPAQPAKKEGLPVNKQEAK
jgi:hypothetical protein